MKALLKQISLPYPTVEEATDGLAGVQVMEGCVFAYVDIEEKRTVSFHVTNPHVSADQAMDNQAGQLYRGQKYVVVHHDEEDGVRMSIAKE